MRNVTVALTSFAVGAVCMSVVGNHTSTRLQPVFAQGVAVKIGGAVPIVPPLGPRMEGTTLAGPIALDGLNLTGTANLTGVTAITYGGGAFNLEKATFGGKPQLVLTGAAANTAVVLGMFGLLGSPKATPDTNHPMQETANIKEPFTASFVSPYGQTRR